MDMRESLTVAPLLRREGTTSGTAISSHECVPTPACGARSAAVSFASRGGRARRADGQARGRGRGRRASARAHLTPTPPPRRTSIINARVLEAKNKRLTCFEHLLKGLGALMTVPFLGLTGLIVVPANTSVAIMRYGKLDRVINEPGFAWVAPGYQLSTSSL